MKQIDDVFPAYINATIGPCSNLRRFVANKDYMLQRGYEFNLFTRDFLLGGSLQEPVDYSKGLGFRSYLKSVIRKSSLFSVLFQIREQREAEKLMKSYLALDRDPDVIVFHELDSAYYYLKNRKGKKAKVGVFHEDDGIRMRMTFESYPKLRHTIWAKRRYKKSEWVDSQVDRNIFIAFISKDNFEKENPAIPSMKNVAFHNGIDILPVNEVPKVTDFKYNLCITGTVCKRKGQYLIVEALNMISDEAKNKIHVSVIGEGNDLDALMEKAKVYGIDKNISFLGLLPNSEVHNYLCGCDIYILMSNSEGLPISIIEGMRAGLAVISTPIAGIPEEVSDDNGLLINPDASELASIFENMDSYDWKALGVASRKKFEKEYTFNAMISSYCDMMDNLFK